VKFYTLIVSILFFIYSSLAKAEFLLGSEWAQNHPNILPYTSCLITSENKEKLENKAPKKFSAALGLGYTRFFSHSLSLACHADVIENGVQTLLTYRIPLAPIQGFVLGSAIMTGIDEAKGLRVSKLHGKKLSDFFGHYSGVDIGVIFPFLSSPNFSVLSHHGIFIFTSGHTLGAGAIMAAQNISIRLKDNFDLDVCTHAEYITADTTTQRDSEMCLQYVAGRSDSQQIIDIDSLMNLEFRKYPKH
jgi:hypothetical protein